MDDLLCVSHRYGRDINFVIAGGGNTSMKTADRLWVKASGTSLATITPAGFVEMDRAKLQAILEDADWSDNPAEREAEFQRRINAARIHPELNQRPSVEVLLHHLMPQRLVVHTHPTRVNAVTCCLNNTAIAGRAAGFRLIWQPYVDPGWVLASCVAGSVEATRKNLGWQASVILLQNHGLVVAGESSDEIERITGTIMDGFPTLPALFPAVADEARLTAWHDAVAAAHPHCSIASDSSAAVRWVTDTAEGKAAALAGPLTPDQIVYARSFPLRIDGEPGIDRVQSAVAGYVQTYGFEPWVILVAGVGMFAVRSSQKMADITRDVYRDAAMIYRAAHELGGVSVLSDRDRRFIENWEVEAYRRSVAG